MTLRNAGVRPLVRTVLLVVITIVFLYPIAWVFLASMKPNAEIVAGTRLLPSRIVLVESYVEGWRGMGDYTYGRFFANTFLLVIPTVLFTVFSSLVVAYGFARFNFVLKKALFLLMISTVMLPPTVVIIPRYLIFRNLGLLNTYFPFYLPALFATFPFFTFMLIQFLRGIPKEIDESALIDSCNSFQILLYILLPLMTPALVTAFLFQFIWTWNTFFELLIYISSTRLFTVALALRSSLDAMAVTNWNALMAMSFLSILPPLVLFAVAQRYFIEGITTTGLKG